MATKTLRVTLADIVGVTGPLGAVTGEVWARYSSEVRLTDGTIVVLANRRKALDSSGVADFTVVPNNDATIHADYVGFGIVVGWDLTYRGEHGQRVQLKEPGRTITVTSADAAVVAFGLKAPATPVIPLVAYPTEAAVAAGYAPIAEPIAVAGLANRVQITEAALVPQRYGAVMDGTTDDTAAFTAMAAVANNATGRPEIRLLEGTYKLTSPINITRAGWTIGGYSRTAGSRITNAVSDVFTFASGSAGSKHHFHDFRATASAGHIFSVTNGAFYANHLARLTLDVSNTGKSIYNQTSGDFIDNLISVCDFTGTTGHTVPLWKVLSATGGANENTFERGRSTYSGNYVFWIEETAAGQYTNNNIFDGWNFEIPNGGCIYGMSANGWTMRSLGVYDLAGFNGGVTTKDLYVLGKSTGPASRYNKFERVIRHGGTLGGSLFDIKLQASGAPLTRFEQCDLSSGSAGFSVDLGSNSAITLADLGASVAISNRGAQVYQNNGTSVGFYGKTPVGQAAAITSPTAPSAGYVQAEAAAMKTAVDALRTALSNIGITA